MTETSEYTVHGGGEVSWISLDLLERHGVTHGFTTRKGGASRGRFSSLNFSTRQGDTAEAVEENWHRLENSIGIGPGRWALVSQIHGSAVCIAGKGTSSAPRTRTSGSAVEADAVLSLDGVAVPAILTADCLPAVLALPSAESVAVVHAGWQGTLAGVLRESVEALAANSGVQPAELTAGLGPAIGPCCYQVGEELYRLFSRRHGPGFTREVFARADPWLFDLQGANRLQLIEAGLKEENIAAAPFCTSCRQDLFFSHRRDGARTGRMVTFAVPGGSRLAEGGRPASIAL